MARIYLPLAVKTLLPAQTYKVIDLLFVFQKDDIITYSNRNSEFFHVPGLHCELAIQTAINIGLLTLVEKDGGIYKFRINKDFIEKYQRVESSEIPAMKTFDIAKEVKFTNEAQAPTDEITQLKKMVASLQKQLQEKETAITPVDLDELGF